MYFGLSRVTDKVVRLPLATILLLVACVDSSPQPDVEVQASPPQPPAEFEILSLIEEMEASDRALGFEPTLYGKEMPPPGLADAIDDYSPSDLFRQAAGYYVSLNHLPALYSSSDGFTIVAPQFERTFPIDSLDAAIREYAELLASRGITGADADKGGEGS